MAQNVDNNEDVLDSRDVIERLQELTDLEEAGELDEDEAEELTSLKNFADEGANSASDWEYGATLVRDSYFTEYAEEFAEEIGAIPPSVQWPMTCIDWEAAANDLREDYSQVDFDGVTYWVR